MIEVMIAVLLLAAGGLGVAMTQATALRRTQGAMLSTTAVHASASLAEAMRANRLGVQAGDYSTNGLQCAPFAAPSGGKLADQDLHRWREALTQGMDEGAKVCGQVKCSAGSCTLEVRWDDSRATSGEGNAAAHMSLGVVP